ncbi:MAG: J domain-containing protein [Spirochaetaceae bacterium]
MTVDAAFQLLQLDETATLHELSVSFRRLLKEYHPDRNIHRREWSHRMTVQLNRAYELVSSHLKEVGDTSQVWDAVTAQAAAEAAYESARSSDAYSGYTVTLQARMATLYDQLLDAIFLYYNFGLENVHRRREGTPRYRYRTALKRLKDVISGLEELDDWPGSDYQHELASVVRTFSAGFYENMLVRAEDHQGIYGEEQKAYRYFRRASDHLDGAIKGHLFGNQLPGGNRSPEAVSSCEGALMAILANHPRSRWVPETLIKLYLLQSFVTFCRKVLYPET